MVSLRALFLPVLEYTSLEVRCAENPFEDP